jgi:XapX domain-containing protein
MSDVQASSLASQLPPGFVVTVVGLSEIQKSLADANLADSLNFAHSFPRAEFLPMNYLISLAIGLGVGLLYGALDFRSPAPPAIALVGLLGMLAGEQLWPMGRQLVAGWLS